MILIRVHEAEGTVTHRIEFFPTVIGRSIHCGVRIDDSSVSAQHAELHATEEGFILRDLTSTNGVYQGKRRIDSLTLAAQDTVYLGTIRLDITTTDQTEKTAAKRILPNQTTFGAGTPLKIGLALVLAYVGLLLISASDQYEISWPPERLRDIFSKGFMLWAAVVVSTLLISLFCKLNAKRFYFYQVLLLIVAAAMATKACFVLAPTAIYNLRQLPLAGLIGHVGNGLIAYWTVFLLQRYVFQRLSFAQRSLIAAAAAAMAICATQIQIDLSRNGERPIMAPLGLDLRPAVELKPNADDLFFDLALSVTAADRQRIKILEALEIEHASN